MRVARHIVDDRRKSIAELLQRHRYLEIADLCKELGISEATARRDLAFLEKSNLITRTYGGALSEFNVRFPSFLQRQGEGASGKREIAHKAVQLLRPGQVVFLDGGTTIFAFAEALRDSPVRPLTCVTSNLPAADLLAEVDGLDIHLLGGQVLRRQSVLLGEEACRNAGHWNFDLALLSAEGMTREGLWNSQPAVVALQKAVIAQSRCKVALIDRSKLGRTAPQFLGNWSILDGILTDLYPKELDKERINSLMTEISHITSILDKSTFKKSSKSPLKSRESTPEKHDYQNDKNFLLPTSLL